MDKALKFSFAQKENCVIKFNYCNLSSFQMFLSASVLGKNLKACRSKIMSCHLNQYEYNATLAALLGAITYLNKHCLLHKKLLK